MAREKTIAYYTKLIKQLPNAELKVTSLSEYINAIIAINTRNKRLFFRGQRNMDWPICSSAYRLLDNPTQFQLQKYHEKIIQEIRNLAEESTRYLPEMALIAHLQHTGGKTNLLDYSLNPLVSLWFACISEPDCQGGAVYVFENNILLNTIIPIDESTLLSDVFEQYDFVYILDPPNINRRIISQQSIFLISASGLILKDNHIAIIIEEEHKAKIIEQLNLIGINNKTLFPDINGFVEWFQPSITEINENTFDDTVLKAKNAYKKFDYSTAISLYSETVFMAANLFGDYSQEIASIYSNMAESYFGSGEYHMALDYQYIGLSIRKKVLGKEHLDIARSYNSIAGVFFSLGEYSKALELYNKALSMCEKVLGEGHINTAASYNNIAGVYLNLGRYSIALELYKKALTIYKNALNKEHPHIASSYGNIANLYAEQGEHAKALELHKKALVIREKVLGTEHPLTATSYGNTANLYAEQGEYSTALELYIKSLAIREKVLGTEHNDTATSYMNMANVYAKLGEDSKALELHKKALAIREKVLGKEHPHTALGYNNMANVYMDQGKYLEALDLYNSALAVCQKVFGEDHVFTAGCYHNIATVYVKQGEYSKALELYNKALAIREKVLGKEHPATITTNSCILAVEDNHKNQKHKQPLD
jgi:Tfp pilus assembly protein PilF